MIKYYYRILLLLVINLIVVTHTEGQTNASHKIWDVVIFGAKSDGKTINTEAIQKAIDYCHAAGGGIVKIPTGVYISGTLFLTTGVQFYLDKNAVIKASQNHADYITIKGMNGNGRAMFGEKGSFLIYAENARNISIKGEGEIDGSGDVFWEKEMLSSYVRKPKSWRPNAMIGFVNCKKINIQNVHLTNAPCYTLWALGCKNITINAITIINDVTGPNTDGLDMDCCRNVVITNCNIQGGDDAIAIKSDAGRLGKNISCKNILVSDCKLSSPPACGIRVGYEGDGVIKNCRFKNISIYNSNHGLNVVSILAERPEFPMLKGTRIKNIVFDNITMNNVSQPIYLWMGNDKTQIKTLQYIKNISIKNITAQSIGDSYIGSVIDKPLKNISLSHVQLRDVKSFPESVQPYTNVWGSKNPYVFYIKNIKGLKLDKMNIDFSGSAYNWQHAVYMKNVKAKLNGLSITNQEKINLPEPVKYIDSFIKTE